MTGGFFYFEPLRLPESPRRQRTDIARERRAWVVAPYRFPVNGIPRPYGAPPFSKGGLGCLKVPVPLQRPPC